jgi:hypothetical protein
LVESIELFSLLVAGKAGMVACGSDQFTAVTV